MALFHQLAQTLTVSPKPLVTRTCSVLYKGLFGNTPVAVKVLTNHNTNEINVQHEIQPHPNILFALASTKRISDGSPALIYPYIEQGSLESYFRTFRMDQTPLHERLQLLVQITDALVHLECANILHCDLKASNILLQSSSNEKLVPMLNDFGESIVQQPQQPTNKLHIRGSPYHMAPELLQLKVQDHQNYCNSSSSSSSSTTTTHLYTGVNTDMYSFGVLCYELLEMKTPYLGIVGGLPGTITHEELYSKIINEQYRPMFSKAMDDDGGKHSSSNTKKEMIQLIKECWSSNPRDRPVSFVDVAVRLNDLTKRVESSNSSSSSSSSNSSSSSGGNISNSSNSSSKSSKSSKSSSNPNKLSITAGSWTDIGGRKTMEDVVYVNVNNTQEHVVAGVFDGHGGDHVAVKAAEMLAAHAVLPSSSSSAVVSDLYQHWNQRFAKDDQAIPCGSTATACAIQKRVEQGGGRHVDTTVEVLDIAVGWVGDSQAMLVQNDGCGSTILFKTINHNPSHVDEQERIESIGGCVKRFERYRDDGATMPYGPWRVFTACGSSGLAVSRALGDRMYEPYVTAVHDERQVTVTVARDDKKKYTLVMATDGIWDVLGEEEVVAMVEDLCRDFPGVGEEEDEEHCWSTVLAHQMGSSALEKKTADNCGVVVIHVS